MKQIIALLLICAAFSALFVVPAKPANYLFIYTTAPTPTPVPTPAGITKGTIYYPGDYVKFSTTGTNNCKAANLTGLAGCALFMKWAAVEPRSGVFDWSQVTAIEAQLPAGEKIQFHIETGEGGDPITTANCTSVNSPSGNLAVAPNPTCQPWLNPASFVNTIWDKTNPGAPQNQWQQNIPSCTVLEEPDPTDATYIAAWKGLMAGIQAQFTGDTKIAYISVVPISHFGSDVSMATRSKIGNTCPTPSVSYSAQWKAIANASSSGAGNSDAAFDTWVQGAYTTLYSGTGGLVPTVGTVQNISQWIEGGSFPSMITPGNANNNIPLDLFQNVIIAHEPTSGTFLEVGQEGQNASLSACNYMRSVPGPPPNGGYVVQGLTTFSNVCSTVLSAYACFGALPNGSNTTSSGCNSAEQVYAANFGACPSTITAITGALLGTSSPSC